MYDLRNTVGLSNMLPHVILCNGLTTKETWRETFSMHTSIVIVYVSVSLNTTDTTSVEPNFSAFLILLPLARVSLIFRIVHVIPGLSGVEGKDLLPILQRPCSNPLWPNIKNNIPN